MFTNIRANQYQAYVLLLAILAYGLIAGVGIGGILTSFNATVWTLAYRDLRAIRRPVTVPVYPAPTAPAHGAAPPPDDRSRAGAPGRPASGARAGHDLPRDGPEIKLRRQRLRPRA